MSLMILDVLGCTIDIKLISIAKNYLLRKKLYNLNKEK